jgi:hypothetical protein
MYFQKIKKIKKIGDEQKNKILASIHPYIHFIIPISEYKPIQSHFEKQAHNRLGVTERSH